VGLSAKVSGPDRIGSVGSPTKNGQLHSSALNYEPMDRLAVDNSAHFTSVFPHTGHSSLPSPPIPKIIGLFRQKTHFADFIMDAPGAGHCFTSGAFEKALAIRICRRIPENCQSD
jgi:hypothetical protein